MIHKPSEKSPRVLDRIANLARLAMAILVTSSCFYRETAPKVAPINTIEIDGSSAAPSDQPLRVIFASPQGETTESTEISILFNRPMRTLDLGGIEKPFSGKISPDIPGSWQWIGTQGLYFSPQTRLPYATDVVVSLPAGIRSLDGTALSEPYVFQFGTRRPALVSVTPSDHSNPIRPSTSFSLRFNQPITEAEIARAIKLTASSKPTYSIPYTVRRANGQFPDAIEIMPSEPLPLDSKIQITADESLRGVEGPLTAGKPAVFEFETYGPLRVVDYYCGYDRDNKVCTPGGSVHIALSNPVYGSEARKSVSVSPHTRIEHGSYHNQFPAREFHMSGGFLPSTDYRITINQKLRDIYGQSLDKTEVVLVRFGNRWSDVKIGLGDPHNGIYRFFMDPGTVRTIPVTYVNANPLELLAIRMGEEDVGQPPSPYDVMFDHLAAMPGATRVQVRQPFDPNHTGTHLIRPSDVLGGTDKRGPIIIATRRGVSGHCGYDFDRTQSSLVQVTDLGISAKISRYGSLIWINRLSSGKPVDGAEVRIRARGGSADSDEVYITDSNGIALVDSKVLRVADDGESSPTILAKHGQDWVYQSANDVQEWYLYGVGTASNSNVSPIGMVFTDRGIYRPGDTLKVKAILRDPRANGAADLARRTAQVTIKDRRSKAIASRDVRLSQFGTLAVDFRVPENASLGRCEVSVSVDGSKGIRASSGFEVAEFRQAEFKVTTAFDRPSYIRGDTATCIAHGEYLFGSPVVDADASIKIERREFRFEVPHTEGFITSDYEFGGPLWDDVFYPEVLARVTPKLDQNGYSRVNTHLELPKMSNAESVHCEAGVSDFSRQHIASSAMAIVHPAEFYLAIRPGSSSFAISGGSINPKVAAVDPEGRRYSGVAVKLQLIQHTWEIEDARSDYPDQWRFSSQTNTVVGECTAHTTNAVESCSMKVPAAGFYTIRAEAVDRRGNPIAASTHVYATGSDAPLLRPKNHYGRKLELVGDREHYEIGDTANIIVKSPFPDAEALVTVERDGIYSHRLVRLRGALPVIEVPITKDFDPNAYVSVLVIRGRTKKAPNLATEPDPGAPESHVAYANIRVNPESKRFSVGLSTGKTEFRPGEQVTVDLKVTDRAGKGQSAEVTVYAVDEGVLMLTKYETPSPFPVFTAVQPLRVEFGDTRRKPYVVRFGANSRSEPLGRSVRTDFKQTAYYNPSVITDNAGNAKVTFKLPDNLTTYRIMAVAVGKTDRFGSGESTIKTHLPLLARAAFPRLLRAGDELEAGVVVTSKSIPKSAIDVKTSVVGAQLIGPATQRIELDPLRSEEVRFRYRANSVGNAKFKFSVKGGCEEDTLEITRPVKSPAILETVALYGSTNSSAGEKLGNMSAIRSDVGDLSISLSSSALVGLGANLKFLTEYPYDCSEQLASRLVPLVSLRALSKFYSIPIPANTSSFVTSTVGKLIRRQKRDGGFGIWDGSTTAHPWVSAYILWSLSLAKKSGIEVPDQTIESGKDYVRKYLESRDESDIGVVTSAFMVGVLAETGEPDADAMSRLYEKRSTMPLFSRALLAHAMSVGKGDAKSRTDLIRDLESHVQVRGNSAAVAENLGTAYEEVMDSSTRTNALVLRALLAASKKHSLAAPLAR
ncbi:MAG: MG2 domain-containing protein, partial [Polyangiaceae bacterium]|nr:MG2 domain-containing protein [Polyangiaceae bacterium]